MSSIRFSSFGAATVPLSKIVIDKELDMGQYPIKAYMNKAPYRLEELETVALDWGDVPPSEVIIREQVSFSDTGATINILTAESNIEVCVRVTVLPDSSSHLKGNAAVRINESDVYSLAGLPPGSSKTTPPLILEPDDVLTTFLASQYVYGSSARVELIYTGRVVGAKTFDLTGKWLALGIDMKGLAATIKIQGVEIPYSDYIYCFPLAPTELKIPGEWDASQERPVIKVYK